MSDPLNAELFVSRRMESAERHDAAGGAVAVFSTPSPNRGADNQDAALIIALGGDRAVLAVADGVGGHTAGAEAARAALDALLACVRNAGDDEPSLRAAIIDGIEQANAVVLRDLPGAATTLVAAEIADGAVRAYHVGDSSLLAVGQRGRIRHQCIEHSPVGYALHSGLIEESEAIHHEDRHLVSNVVGSGDMRIEIGPAVRLRPRDTVVLGSDGLFDNLRRDEIIARIRTGDIVEAADRLARDARRRMGPPESGQPSKPDDLTFIMFRPTARARRPSSP